MKRESDIKTLKVPPIALVPPPFAGSVVADGLKALWPALLPTKVGAYQKLVDSCRKAGK